MFSAYDITKTDKVYAMNGNHKKLLWVRAVKITTLLLVVVLFVLLMPVNDFDDAPRIKNFYLEEPNSLDVVVLGSSEDYAGYSPVLAYEEYGFTSYPFVFSANAFSLFKGQLDEVLRAQSPKVIVVDVAEIINVRDHDTVLRQFLAAIPFSQHKIELIREYGDSAEVLSYLFPFFVNHGKSDTRTMLDYIKLNTATRERGYSLLKGAISFTGSGENWDGPYVTPINTSGDYSTVDLQQDVIDQCRNMLAACQAHPEVTFLFVNYPHRIATEEQYQHFQQMNAVGELIKSAGYDFLNLDAMTDVLGLMPETDFYNNHHMNLYGQYKTTRFLCEILAKEYQVRESQISPENREKWDTCVEYQKLYYQLFDEEFKARDPEEFGLWLQENTWLLSKLEEMKQEHDS